MKILILGCGYAGCRLGECLVAEGHSVWGLRRSAAADQTLLSAGIRPALGDLSSPEHWTDVPRDLDAVVNAASSKGGDIDAYRSLYLEGTRRILDWLRGRPLKSYVQISSTSVYGQSDGSWVDENAPTAPSNATSRILVETEQTLLRAAADRGVPVTLLRSAGIYGPGRGHLFQQFLRGEARITGDGSRWLNMIHRDDLADAALHCVLNPAVGRVLNLCDDEPVTEHDFFSWLAAKMSRPMPPSADPGASPRKRGASNKRVSNRALRQLLARPLRFPTFRNGYTHLLPG